MMVWGPLGDQSVDSIVKSELPYFLCFRYWLGDSTKCFLKVVVPHCGAYLPLAIPRMKLLTRVMQANKMVGDIDYEANLASLYYDLAGTHSLQELQSIV